MTQENIDDILGIDSKSQNNPKSNSNISNLVINPSDIIKAGKDIKGVVYVVIVTILISLFIAFAAYTYPKYHIEPGVYVSHEKTIKNLYYLACLVPLIGNIVILYFLYSAGHNLEKSVKVFEEK